MKSPFQFGRVVTGDTFTDRIAEIKRLKSNIEELILPVPFFAHYNNRLRSQRHRMEDHPEVLSLTKGHRLSGIHTTSIELEVC